MPQSQMHASRILAPAAIATLLMYLGTLSGCGDGGGASSSSTPPPAARDLALRASNLSVDEVEVATSYTYVFDFDAEIAAEGLSTLVQLRDGVDMIPVNLEVRDTALRITPSQRLKMRTEYTLTISAGLRARNGGSLRSDLVRRFKTIWLDINNEVVQPGHIGLTNYPGQYTFRIGDVNGDGLPDIVQIGGDFALKKGNDFAVNVFLQNPDHSFHRAQQLLLHEEQEVFSNLMGEIEIIDLDHDDVPEIIISLLRRLPRQSGLIVLKQDAQGHYQEADFIATEFAHQLFVADIDRDGKQDVLSIGDGRDDRDNAGQPDPCGMVALLSSAGGARLQSPTMLPCHGDEAVLGPGYEAVLGSLENPGELNLVLLRSSFVAPVNSAQERLKFYSLDAAGRATLHTGLMAAAASVCAEFDCSGMMLMDATGDGIQELVFTRSQLQGGTVIYTREGQSPYAVFLNLGFGAASAFTASDLDRDGIEDLAVVLQDEVLGSRVVAGFFKPGPEVLFSRAIPILSVDFMKQETVGVADLNVDGLPDVVLDSYNIGLSVLFQRLH
jgi:hypothetical protein